MMISGVWPSQLNEQVSFYWSKQGFRYLGIILAPNPSQLFEVNYKKKKNFHKMGDSTSLITGQN